MRTGTLGTKGPLIPVLGLGTAPWARRRTPLRPRDACRLVHTAIDLGMALFDTAQNYAGAEALLGQAIHRYRDRCFVASKISFGYRRKDVRRAVHATLGALRTDYVDLYQIHEWDTHVPVEETLDAMCELKDQGKIRYLGVSNFGVLQMSRALEAADVVSNQVGYSLFERKLEDRLLPFCVASGVGVMVHSPLASGLLTAAIQCSARWPDFYSLRFGEPKTQPREVRFDRMAYQLYSINRVRTARRIEEIAKDRRITLIQLALAWLLRLNGVCCVLTGTCRPDHLREHFAASSIKLTPTEILKIDTLLRTSNETR